MLVIHSYSSGTFTLSTVIGASATISFNATGITLVGSMWDNHGNYNITLDGTVFPKNGYSQARVFNASLFTISNLDNKLHTISFTNAGTDPNTSLDYVDLDYARIVCFHLQSNSILSRRSCRLLGRPLMALRASQPTILRFNLRIQAFCINHRLLGVLTNMLEVRASESTITWSHPKNIS